VTVRTLTLAQLCGRLQLSARQVYAYRKTFSHPAIQELDGPGRPRFSLDAVEAWEGGGCQAPRRRPRVETGRSLYLAKVARG
jgi:hypothetical protein